jgi:hypothetical protein
VLTRPNHLFYGDNLNVLREQIKDESVDLVPPFNSQANYNVLFRSPTGTQSPAQIEAFENTWHWNEHAEKAFDEVMTGGNSTLAELPRALRSALKENDMVAYLTMMAVRLQELHLPTPSQGLWRRPIPTALCFGGRHGLKVSQRRIWGMRSASSPSCVHQIPRSETLRDVRLCSRAGGGGIGLAPYL